MHKHTDAFVDRMKEFGSAPEGIELRKVRTTTQVCPMSLEETDTAPEPSGPIGWPWMLRLILHTAGKCTNFETVGRNRLSFLLWPVRDTDTQVGSEKFPFS